MRNSACVKASSLAALAALAIATTAAAGPVVIDHRTERDANTITSPLAGPELPEGAQLMTVPDGASLTEHVYAPGIGLVSAGDPPGTLVYANTRGAIFLGLPPGIETADDVITTALGGCDLGAYQLIVSGGGDGTGPGFTVDFAIYNACPGAGGQVIPGTDGSLPVDDDGVHMITVDLSAAPVSVGASVWVATSFSRLGAGWVVGSAADVGFTDNVYDLVYANRCESTFGGSSLYAGFATKLFCAGQVGTQFLAYLNSGPGTFRAIGAGQTLLDDVALYVDECTLSGYEVGLIGNAGPYNAEIELWSDCDRSSAIPGTDFTFAGVGNGSLETASISFPQGIPLTVPAFWIAITPSRASTGPIFVGEPAIGTSQDLYATWQATSCGFFWFNGTPHAAISATAFCQGDPPFGACCDVPPPPGGSACVETAEISCGGRWSKGAVCDPDPFDPPCGTFACCLPNDTCENLVRDDCDAADGAWQNGRFCDQGLQTCPFRACESGQGDCCAAQGTAGCGNRNCCETICEMDAWCCGVEWDQICANEAAEFCHFSCPDVGIHFQDPLDGTVDARQPHPPFDASTPQGLDTFAVIGAESAAVSCCWELCETAHTGIPNRIESVEVNEGGILEISLTRPITPGAVTTLTYRGNGTAATFIAHPGNANGNIETSPADILSLIDCLNGLTCTWGTYSCDIDHSGTCGPSDILREIDLINGAGEFLHWGGSILPMNVGECP